ncbi:MAG: hypothetical protein AAGU19_20870 [Prolixibacteraceae bacterium]
MEDYIFILVAILLSVFGAINRKKKQGQITAEEEETPAERRPSVFDQLFDDPLFAEEKPREVKSVEPKRVSVAEAYQAISKRNIPAKSSYVPPVRKPTIPLRKPPMVIEIKERPPKRKVHPLMKDFTLKKAVVYSEILQRKY